MHYMSADVARCPAGFTSVCGLFARFAPSAIRPPVRPSQNRTIVPL
jgi:hypothetical protein